MYFNFKYYNKWWYKVLTVLLIIAVLITITFAPIQSAKAVGVLTATMGAAILAVLAGAGVYTVVSGMTWDDIQTWLTDRLNAWDAYRNDGKTWEEILDPLNNKVGATVSGFLKIEYDLASKIVEFVNWLVNTDFQMVNNQVYTAVASFTVNGQICYKLPYNNIISETPGIRQYLKIQGSQNVRVYRDNSNNLLLFGLDDMIANDRGYSYNYADEPNSIWPGGGSGNLDQTMNGYRYTLMNFSNESARNTIFNDLAITKGALSYTEIMSLPYVESSEGLELGSDVIGIPDVDTDDEDIYINAGAYPGAILSDIINRIINGILDNVLNVSMTITNEFADSQAVVITNELPISVDTDHHLFGFQLPNFNFNFASIWHYVNDAIDFASGWIAWFVAMITAVPVLAIPLYMAFTLIVIISFIKRVIL